MQKLMEHGWELWKADVKHLLNAELEAIPGWNPTFKINDIVMKITMEQYQDLFTSQKGLPRYYDFGKSLVRQYNILKQKQILMEIAESGCGCA